MAKTRFRPLVQFAGFVLAVLVYADCARAAGEWEWTSGQGWVQGAGVARPTPKEQLHYAYELEKKGEYMDSARQYFLLVQNFPSSQEAGVGLQRLARCLFEMENYWTSYKAIEQVIETYPNTGRMSDLVEIELRIAKKMMVSQSAGILAGNEGSAPGYNIRQALKIIDSVIEHDPYGPVAAEAYLVKGEGHLFINEITASRKAFETIRDEFPRSEYIERARLGILQCDSLVGQANPREVQEQMDVVRETERERAQRRRDEMDEEDDIDASLRRLSEVEAAKMMEQAEQYQRMGTREGVKASEFLYNEIARRYPATPQAEESLARLGNLKMPKEQGRLAKVIKNINVNPFSYGKDPEPPWIIPQLSADDQIMIDSGIGPIAGVTETGSLPATDYSAPVRPYALNEAEAALAAAAPPAAFSPAEVDPTLKRAPKFVDGTIVSPLQEPEPQISGMGGFMSPPPGASGFEASSMQPARNPLSFASDSDLVQPAGSMAMMSGPPADYTPPYQTQGLGGYQPQQNAYQAPQYDNEPVYNSSYTNQPQSGQPNLGSARYHASNSDLVGPVPSTSSRPPLPDFDGVNSYSPAPQQNYYNQYQTPSYPQPHTVPTTPPATGNYGGNGGWTLSEDFR